jgi:predicted oxidoreductase
MDKMMPLQKRNISSSRLVFGCMSLGRGGWDGGALPNEEIARAEQAVEAALSIGITMFDHADIYGRGKAEALFGEVLKRRPDLRDRIVIQTKCGIRFPEGDLPNRYDFSKSHILRSVDGSLKRLGTEYIDVLLLHRPDPLVEPEEVAEAFESLKQSGKVRHFGVSNMNAAQIRLLQAFLPDPLVVNQLEMSLLRIDWLDEGVHVNQKKGTEVHFGEGTIEHCRLEQIQLQAWGPLARGMFSGRPLENPPENVLKTKALVQKLAAEKQTSVEAIVLGWLMRHPAMIQPVIGTSDPERIRRCEDAVRQADTMTRDEWYSLYVASRGSLLP